MPSHTELKLNFGVEFEFFAVIPTPAMDKLLKRYNKKHPAFANFSAVSDSDHNDRREALLEYIAFGLREEAGLRMADINHPPGYDRWTLTSDDSIKFPPKGKRLEGHEYYAFELVSRILPLNDLVYQSHTHPSKHIKGSGTGIQEVDRALALLADAAPVSFDVNDSCSLHVHVGLAPKERGAVAGAAYKRKDLQNLGALVTLFEPYVKLVLANARSSKQNNSCKKPSHTRGLEDLDLKGRLAKLYASRDVFEFQEIMNPRADRDHAYNFQNIKAGGSMTIEFRQHQGTLDADVVSGWVQVVAGFVRTAHTELSQERLANWRRRVDQNEMTPSDFLRKIGKENLVEFYRKVRRTKSVKVVQRENKWSKRWEIEQ